MRSKRAVVLGALLLLAASLVRRGNALAEGKAGRIARIAEIEVDSQQVGEYRAALREQIASALRLEPGVITLYAVSVKGHPEQVTVFEVYASVAAYQHHLQTAHFKKYKADTEGMVKSLKLIETDPILLRSRTVLGE